MVNDHPRPAAKIKALPWRYEDACPCGSSISLVSCCSDGVGGLRKLVPSIVPAGAVTKHTHPSCYLNVTENCDTKLSAEHYVSRGALLEYGDKVQVQGFPWLPGSETKVLGVDNLTARILCVRHNNALSPLDAEGALFLRTLRQVHQHLQKRSLSKRNRFYLLSGDAIELWMLKTLAGMYHSKNATSDGAALASTSRLNEQLVVDALQEQRWLPNCGLYFRSIVGEDIASDDAIGFAPLTSHRDGRTVGCKLKLVGLEFTVVVDPFGVNFDSVGTQNTFRPTNLVFEHETMAHVLVLTWPSGTPPRTITLHWNRRRGV